jgi:GTPase SAR1 family protein
VGKLTDLQTLRLQGLDQRKNRYLTIDPETTAALASALAALPHLVELDLCCNSLPSEAADVLARELQHLTGLTRLKLFNKECGWPQISNTRYDVEPACRLLEAVGSMAGLRSFSMLGFCRRPTDERIEEEELIAGALGALAGLTRLEELDMRCNILRAEAATAFAGTLTRLTRLTQLTMGRSPLWDKEDNSLICPEAVAALTEPLVALTSLTKLQTYRGPWNRGPWSPATIKTLASALGRMPALTWLDASGYGNSCGPAGATALAAALGNLTLLQTLDLYGNAFGAQGAAALAPSLQRLTGLTCLNLAKNELMHEDDKALPLGLGVLAPALAEMAHLTHLDLRENDQTGGEHSDAIEKLADSLKKTTNMTALYLPHAQFPGWCQPLRDALLCMTSLSKLVVGQAGPDEMDWGMALPGEVMCPAFGMCPWMKTLAYVRELGAQGAVPCSMLRLLIIGMGEAGKTCLKQALMSDTHLSPPIATDDRTIGIDTHPSWKPDGEDLDFTVWDFAGQRGYQTGHSPFLSERCLSMLVFRPDQGASADAIFEEWVRPWLELLHAHSPGAHVLLVCTRWTSPPAGEELGAYQRRIRDICECISKLTRAREVTFNKATKSEFKRLGEKASKLEQKLQQLQDEMQAPPPVHGGHGVRRREALERQSKDLTEELEAARNRRTKLCDKRSQVAKQMQILAASEGANACADMVHLVESVEGDGSTVKSLREALVRTARGLPFVGENIPRGWLTFKNEIQTFYENDKSILVTRASLMSRLRESPQLKTWLVGREAENRVLEFWGLLGFMLVTHDQSHVIVSPPKLIDLLKPLVHHQPFRKLEDTGQAQTVVENFDELDFEVQGKIREIFERLEDRYILDATLLKHLRFWFHMDDSARDQALQILCDLNLVVPHRGGARSADEQRFLCVCRLHRDSHSFLQRPGPVLPDIKISVKYTIFPIFPLGLFPRFLATQIVARSKDRQSQPRISPTSLYIRASPLGTDQEMLIKLNPSDSIIEVQCTSIGLLRDVCCTLEHTVNHLFPGLSFHTQLRFSYEEKGMYTWDIHPDVVGHSFGTLLAQKLWNKTKMDVKPENVENVGTAEYNVVRLKNILKSTLGLKASFFLSHCWRDKSKDYAKDLVSMLEDVSRDLVWYDEEQLECVNHFPSKMQEGVRQAKCIIIFLSRVYLSRQNCLLELQWAWEEHLLKGKSLIVLPVDEAVTAESLREWAQPGTNLPVQEQPDQGGTFTIHHNTLKFVSEKLTGFGFREEWRGASATEEERWKAVQEICDYVVDARTEHVKVPKRAKLECRKADCGTWMLVDLGEEVSEIESEEKPIHDSIKKLFDKIGLGPKCAKICNELSLHTMHDLEYFEPEYLEDLPVDLLRRLEKRKLADNLATLQAELKIPQRLSGRAIATEKRTVEMIAPSGVSSLNDKRPHIVAFFAKKDTDVTYMLEQLQIRAENPNVDKEQMSKEMYSLIRRGVDTLKLDQEAETLMFGFRHPRSLFTVQPHLQTTFEKFKDCMLNARQNNTRIVHLSGHSNFHCGFFWLKDEKSTEYEENSIEAFAKIFETEVAGARSGGTIECVVLNACETEEVGRKLQKLGVPYVVCWRSEVRDETAITFSEWFYKALDSQKGPTDYRLAFQQATNRLDSTESNSSEDASSSRKPAKHTLPGARDFICLLSADGQHDQFPDTGFISVEVHDDSSKERRCLDNAKGRAELKAFKELGFTFTYKGKDMFEGIEKHKKCSLSKIDAASYGLEIKHFNRRDSVVMTKDAAWELFQVESYSNVDLWKKDGPIYKKAMTVDLSKLDTAIQCFSQSRDRRGAGPRDSGHDHMFNCLDACVTELEACKTLREQALLYNFVQLAKQKLDASLPALLDGNEADKYQKLVVWVRGFRDTLFTVGAACSGQIKGAMGNALISAWDLKNNQPGENLRAGGVAAVYETLEGLLSGPLASAKPALLKDDDDPSRLRGAVAATRGASMAAGATTSQAQIAQHQVHTARADTDTSNTPIALLHEGELCIEEKSFLFLPTWKTVRASSRAAACRSSTRQKTKL